jgi:methionine sulfoxide reductase catalytic subunit
MLIRKPSDIRSSEITDESVYLNRREFMRSAGVLGLGAAAGIVLPASAACAADQNQEDKITPEKHATTHNNFYEFGTAKGDPARNAHTLRPAPWTVRVEGMVAKPANYAIEDFIKPHKIEERIYRMRCVEAWSMVIPWMGIPLASVIKAVQPTSSAKYVEFTTLNDPVQMPGVRSPVLDWPYKEGLRLDEAMHPLAILAVGMYGKTTLPNQNGAPIRLVTPWKYGFKGIKSIVSIRFTDRQPDTAWNVSAPDEYGFYANVNPEVDHPRWSQRKERRLEGNALINRTIDTKLFNGYMEVASLYSGMDLRKNY